MNPQQQSCPTGEHRHKTAASREVPKRSPLAEQRGHPGMEFLAYYISILKQSNTGIPCLAEVCLLAALSRHLLFQCTTLQTSLSSQRLLLFLLKGRQTQNQGLLFFSLMVIHEKYVSR